MKKLLMPLCLLCTLFADAQKEGKVIYERTIQMRRQNASLDMGERIPPTRTDNFELLFGNNQVLWRNLPSSEASETNFSGNGTAFRMMTLNEESYFNLAEGVRVDKREMFDREFIIEDSVRKLNWKVSGESKTLLGHQVQKATAQRIGTRMMTVMENNELKRREVADTSVITAWFTTDFPVSAGPQEFQGQLPGLILEMDMNDRISYKAVEISPKVSLSSIRAPKGGKRMTPAEFAKEREQMMEEMRKNMPGGMRIRMEN